MAKLWTFSGVNSYSPKAGQLVDYVWEKMPRPMQAPNRHYISRLGTTRHYKGDKCVKKLASESILDQEALDFAEGRGGKPIVRRGMFKGKKVRCLLVAPKTTTLPPRDRRLIVEIYWCPLDGVPNQSIFQPESRRRWKKYRRGGGQLYAVQNLRGRGIAKGHDYAGFMVPAPLKMVRKKKRLGKPPHTYEWKLTKNKETEPGAYTRIWTWLNDKSVDYVFVAHSQGTNIAMHVLERGFAKPA